MSKRWIGVDCSGSGGDYSEHFDTEQDALKWAQGCLEEERDGGWGVKPSFFVAEIKYHTIEKERLEDGQPYTDFEITPTASAKNKPKRPVIVCLCGSTRFMEAFRRANLEETLAGKIVLTVGCDTKSDSDLLALGELTKEKKAMLDELHKRKIDLASEV